MSTADGATARPFLFGPTSPGDRVELIDVLRGFALLGILLVNFQGEPGEATAALDGHVDTWIDILFASSFYPIFSLLFGLGFAVQLLRALARAQEPVWPPCTCAACSRSS